MAIILILRAVILACIFLGGRLAIFATAGKNGRNMNLDRLQMHIPSNMDCGNIAKNGHHLIENENLNACLPMIYRKR